jgi:hypothetical protein
MNGFGHEILGNIHVNVSISQHALTLSLELFEIECFLFPVFESIGNWHIHRESFLNSSIWDLHESTSVPKVDLKFVLGHIIDLKTQKINFELFEGSSNGMTFSQSYEMILDSWAKIKFSRLNSIIDKL